MDDPFREAPYRCPVCPATGLREYQTRLCCDACGGIQLTLVELGRAIEDLTGMLPTYEYLDEEPGARTCPVCSTGLTRCRLHLTLEQDLIKTRTVLDRCDQHGLWFDRDELAEVLARARAKVIPRGGSGRAVSPRARASGDSGNDLWSGSARGFRWWGLY